MSTAEAPTCTYSFQNRNMADCERKSADKISEQKLTNEDEEQSNSTASSDGNMELSYPEKWIKHPLKHTWTMWYFRNDKNNSWIENNKLIFTFSTVEDFWCLYNYLRKASNLGAGCDYSVFKDTIRPMWEDDQNKGGGRWLISMNRTQRNSDLDNIWLEMLLCLIGEAFDEQGGQICGAVVNIRGKGDKLGVWTRDYTNKDAVMSIGGVLRERLNVPPNCVIGYQAHKDTCVKAGSTVKNLYTV